MTVREQLEQAVERAIDVLNALDGDPDAEAEPFEQDAEAEAWFQPVRLSAY